MSLRIRTEQIGLEESVNDVVNRINRRGINVKVRASDFTQPLGRITQKADEFSKSLEASNARVIAFGASAAIIGGVTTAFRELVVQAVNVEKILTDINVVLGTSSSNLQKFGRDLFDVARNTSQALDVAAEAALEFSRQGLSMEETLRRTNDALILTRLTGIKAADAVSGLTAATNGFADAGLSTTAIINKLAAVDVKFAVSADDLIDALARAGAVAQDAGVNFDQLVGAVTAAQQITARGGAVIGNSFKTIFTRIQRSSTLNNLEKLGVAVRDIEGSTLPAISVLKNLADAYKDMGDATSAAIAEQVGGVFQINVLKAALKDLGRENSLYAQATKISNRATDQAQKKNEMLQKTISSLAAQTSLTIQELSANIGELALSPGISKLLEAINSFAGGLNGLLGDGEESGSSFARGIVKGIGSVLTGPGVVLAFGVFAKLFTNALSFAKASLKDVLGIVSAKDKEKNIQESIVLAMENNKNLALELHKYAGDKVKQEQIILKQIELQTKALADQERIASSLAPKLAKMGVTSQLTLPTGRGSKTSATGFIPNYSAGDPTPIEQQKEKALAVKSGYMPGKVMKMNVKGLGDVVYNNAETVTTFQGLRQPAIMPPEKSKAGRKYLDNFKGKHGFDPYKKEKERKSFSEGFIPESSVLKKEDQKQHKDQDGGSQNSESYAKGFIPNMAMAHRMGNTLKLPKARMFVQTSATEGKGLYIKGIKGWKDLEAKISDIMTRGGANLSPALRELQDMGISKIVRPFYFSDQDQKGRTSAGSRVNSILTPRGKGNKYNDLLGNVYEQELDKGGLKKKNFIRTHTGTVKYAGKSRKRMKSASEFVKDKKGKGDVSASFDFVRKGRLPLEAKANSFSGANLIAKSLYQYSDKSLNNFLKDSGKTSVEAQYDQTKLDRQKDTLSRMGLDDDIDTVNTYNMSSGLIPNFIDPRSRAQKVRDVLSDPANKGIKFRMPKPKHFKAKSMWDQEMLREFKTNPKQSYLGGSLKDYLIKKGYDKKDLESLAKNPDSYRIFGSGMVPNFVKANRASRYFKGVPDPKGKISTWDPKRKTYQKFKEDDSGSWQQEWYNQLKGKTNELTSFLSWVRTNNKLPPRQVNSLQKELSNQSKSYQDRYWETNKKVKSGNAGFYEKKAHNTVAEVPGYETQHLKSFVPNEKMQGLVSEWRQSGSSGFFASGLIPSFSEKMEEEMKAGTEGKSVFADQGSRNNETYSSGHVPNFIKVINKNADRKRLLRQWQAKLDQAKKLATSGRPRAEVDPIISQLNGDANKIWSQIAKLKAGGLIPNFAKNVKVESIQQVKDGDSIVGMVQTAKAVPVDHRLNEVDAIESWEPLGNNATKLAQKYYSGQKGSKRLEKNIVDKGDGSYNRGLFKDNVLAKELVNTGLGIPDLRYTGLSTYRSNLESAKSRKRGIWAEDQKAHPKRLAIESQMKSLTGQKSMRTLGDKDEDTKYHFGKSSFSKQQLKDYEELGPDGYTKKYGRGSKTQVKEMKKFLYVGRSKKSDYDAEGHVPNFSNIGDKSSLLPNFSLGSKIEKYKNKKKTKSEKMGKDDFNSTSTAIASFNTSNALYAKTAISGAKGIRLTARNHEKIRQFLNSKEFRGLSAAVQNKVKKSLRSQSTSLNLPDVTRPWLQHSDDSFMGRIAASLGLIPNFKERKELMEDKMKADELGSQNSNDYARGLVPNFSKNALQQAIQRESDAGIPKSLMRIEKAPELKNPMNPLGLAVTNKIDEPGGVKEGIKRAKEQGIDPQTHGAARGLIPNFETKAQKRARQDPSFAAAAGELNKVAKGAKDASQELGEQASASSDLTGRYFMLTSVAYGLQGAFSEVEGSTGKVMRGFTTLAEAGTQAMLFKEGLGEVGKGLAEKLGNKGGLVGKVGKFAGYLGPLGAVVGAAIPVFQYLNDETGMFKDNLDLLNDKMEKNSKEIEGFTSALDAGSSMQQANTKLKDLENSTLKGTFRGRMEELTLLRQKQSAETALAGTLASLSKETNLTAEQMKLMSSGTAEGIAAIQEKILELENVNFGDSLKKTILENASGVKFFGGKKTDEKDKNDNAQATATLQLVEHFVKNLNKDMKGASQGDIDLAISGAVGKLKETSAAVKSAGRGKSTTGAAYKKMAAKGGTEGLGVLGETIQGLAGKGIHTDEISEAIDRMVKALSLQIDKVDEGTDIIEGDTTLINQIRAKRAEMFASLEKQAHMAQISMQLQQSAHDLAMTELSTRNQFMQSLGTMTKAQQIRADAEEKITQNQLDYSVNVQSLNDEYLQKGRAFTKQAFEKGIIQDSALRVQDESGKKEDESGKSIFQGSKENFASKLRGSFMQQGKINHGDDVRPGKAGKEQSLVNDISSSKAPTQILDHLETYANTLETVGQLAEFYKTLQELGLTQVDFSNAKLEAFNDTLDASVKAEGTTLDIKNKKVESEKKAANITAGSLEYYQEVARTNQQNSQYSQQVGDVLKENIATTIQKNANDRTELAAQMEWLANRSNLQSVGEEEYSNRLLAIDQQRKQIAMDSALTGDTEKLSQIVNGEVKNSLSGTKDKAKRRIQEAKLAEQFLSSQEGLTLSNESALSDREAILAEAKKQLTQEKAISADKAKLAAIVKEEIQFSLQETASKNQRLIEESQVRVEYLNSVEGQSEAAKTQLSVEQLIISQQQEVLAQETALVQDKAKLRAVVADQIKNEEQQAQNTRGREAETHQQKMQGGFYGRRAVEGIDSQREGMQQGLQEAGAQRNFYQSTGNAYKSAEANTDVQKRQLEYNKEMGQGSLLLDTWRVKLAEANERLVNFSADLGETSFDAVKDGFKGLLQDISDGTKSTSEMMMGFIGGIAKKMQDKMFDRFADQMTSGLFGMMGLQQYHTGGFVEKYSRGGTAKDVPAMLTSGEYVVRKKVVDKLGLRTMDKLNEEGSLEDLYNKPNEDQFSLFNEGGIAAPPIVKFQDGGSIDRMLINKKDEGDTNSQNDRSSVFSDEVNEFSNILSRFNGGLVHLANGGKAGDTNSKNDRESVFSNGISTSQRDEGDTASKNDRSSVFSNQSINLNEGLRRFATGGLADGYYDNIGSRKENPYEKDSFSSMEATVDNYGSLGNRWYLSNKNRREATLQDELTNNFANHKKPKLGQNMGNQNRMKSLMQNTLPMFEEGGSVDGFLVKTKLTQDMYGKLGNRWYLENKNNRDKVIQKTTEREKERERLVGFNQGGIVYMQKGGLTNKQAQRRQGYSNMASGLGGMLGTLAARDKKDQEYQGPTAPKKPGQLNTSSRLNVNPTGKKMSARFRKNDQYSQDYGQYLLDKYEYDVQQNNQKALEKQQTWQAVANVVGMAAGTAIGNYVGDKIQTGMANRQENKMLNEFKVDATLDAQQAQTSGEPAGGRALGPRLGGGSLLEMGAARAQSAGITIDKGTYSTGTSGDSVMSFGSADSAPSIPGLKSGPTTHELNQNAQADAIMALERLKYTVDLDKKNKGGLIQNFNRGGSVHSFTSIGNNITKMKDGGLTRNGKVIGPGGIDQVGPVMLDRGEYVVKASSVSNVEKQYPGFFDKINTMKMNQGGPVDIAGGSSSVDNSSTTNNNQKSSSNVTVNINVSGSGKAEAQGGDGEQQAFASRIKDAVVGIIAQEKRVGGMLSG